MAANGHHYACAGCGTNADELVCPRCKLTAYCSVECKEKDAVEHEKRCSVIAENATLAKFMCKTMKRRSNAMVIALAKLRFLIGHAFDGESLPYHLLISPTGMRFVLKKSTKTVEFPDPERLVVPVLFCNESWRVHRIDGKKALFTNRVNRMAIADVGIGKATMYYKTPEGCLVTRPDGYHVERLNRQLERCFQKQ